MTWFCKYIKITLERKNSDKLKENCIKFYKDIQII